MHDLQSIVEYGRRAKKAKRDVLAFVGIRPAAKWKFRLITGGLGKGPDKFSKAALHYVKPKMRARVARTAGFNFGWVITSYRGNLTAYGHEKENS